MSLTSIEAAIGAVGRLSTSSPVVIGSVTLTGIAIPNELRVGGQQRLVVQRLLGGGRVVDAVGNDPDRLEMTGTFTGADALTRAQALEAMRKAGKAITFSGAGKSAQVKIAQYSYTYRNKGAIIPYSISLEVSDSGASTTSAASALSSLIGSDAASALSSVTSTISDVSTMADNFAGEIGTVVGQITPLATLVGAGSGLASVQDALSGVSGITGAVTNLASAPSAVASLTTSFSSAASTLSNVATQAGANLNGITFNGSGALLTISGNSEVATSAVDSLASVDRAAKNTTTAAGVSQ